MVNVLLLGTAAQVSDEARGPLVKRIVCDFLYYAYIVCYI